ncbi:unnamed protein product [Coregonus sp. 'balchen']|nr:unnamed protein product [Coregonus sp. 'balchen']
MKREGSRSESSGSVLCVYAAGPDHGERKGGDKGEAECSFMYCGYPTNSSQYGQNSVPIYQHVLVLYTSATRKCYSVSFLSVAVGCTCAWAMTY